MNSKVTGEGDEEDAEVKKKHCVYRPETATYDHRDENKTCAACRNYV